MRKYRPVAAIEVSEESLRLIAGDEVLGQQQGSKSHALAELRESLADAQAALAAAAAS